jgi:sulfur-carrier protein
MKIRYYATLRDVTSTKEENWEQQADTLQDLIDALCLKYGQQFSRWVSCKDGGYGILSIFLINGKDYRSLDGFKTRLKSNDIISLFPPVAGG